MRGTKASITALELVWLTAYDLRQLKFSRTGSALRKIMNKSQGWAARTIFIIAVAMLASIAAGAQNGPKKETFKARLSPVPIDVSMMSTIAGSGSLTATLSGKQLTIQGTFVGLRSPATTAGIHRAPKGIPGPVVSGLDLSVTKAEKGEISGTLELTAEQIADLKNGLLYVQIQSERAPDGNLWGWVLP